MSENLADIVFGAGCFWGVEKNFKQISGVIAVVSGYAGGDYENPTYQKVLENKDNVSSKNHTEVVKVSYNSELVSAEFLIKTFWQMHDPTQIDGQGNDKGNNYRSAIYWTNDEQQQIALKTKDEYQVLLNQKGFGAITTELKPVDKFWAAEDYHQNYLANNPNGYCPNHRTGIEFVIPSSGSEQREFYRALGELRLDKSAFNIAFNQGTEPSFCQKYDIFKNTQSGVFVDKLSGEALFSTKQRFNSGSGWLSFTQAIPETTIEKTDNSHGMSRTEVLAKRSGIHLGHIFNDGPDGQQRFCINAAVLDFVAD
ncbi:MAG: peptide-methionine (S)-S-oxide reductase MsrA [Candidatus Thioglobus sp.]|nr:MAG: peptide-methionine (S)-S-oxide reductase MsrA [Candidatus Thioglobus sp.]